MIQSGRGGRVLADRGVHPNGFRDRDLRAILIMACVLVTYVIPVVLGYSWNALACGYNALDPPEGSQGPLFDARVFDTRVTVECWGASVVSVPDHIKTRLYLTSGQVPLWNPYQGLGEPFAAMGEGSPYFPPAMIRSLAPYSWENVFLIAEVFSAQCFLFYFLRLFGLSRAAAVFGGATFALSGAISFHLARANILDQICMIPILFWAVAHALSRRNIVSYVIVALVTALHVAGGFIQVAMTTQVMVLVYAATMVGFEVETRSDRIRTFFLVLISTVIGLGLSAFYMLPLLDWLTSGVGKDVPFLGFLNLPIANIVAFFFPILYGPWFAPAWMPLVPGAYSAPNWVPNWDNLYAVSGTGILIISTCAIWGTRWSNLRAKRLYFFFLLASVVLLLRYANIAPVSLVNWLPIIGRQSPKHANALTAFCLIVTASIVVDNLRGVNIRKATTICSVLLVYISSVVMGMFGTYLYSTYETGRPQPPGAMVSLLTYGGLTVFIATAAFLSLRRAIQLSGSTVLSVGLLFGFVCAESFLYVPLGRARLPYIGCQFLIATAACASVCALVYSRRAVALSLLGAASVGYMLLLSTPSDGGLPWAYDLAKPPTFMRWLAANDDLSRTFGIFPDYSVAAKLQDISVVGPLAPPEFKDFVWLISNDRAYNDYLRTGHFMLSGPWYYEADTYFQFKAIFDWLDIKYLIVDPRKMIASEQGKFSNSQEMMEVYHDRRVTVFASKDVRSKAEYWRCVQVVEDQKAILEQLKREPTLILGKPRVEKSDEGSLHLVDQKCASDSVENARVTSYGLDRVILRLPEGAHGGVAVLKDIYAPGWHATIDGKTAQIVRVNGFARGVLVPQNGGSNLTLKYRPTAFVAGVLITGLSAIFIVGLLALGCWRGVVTTTAPGRGVIAAAITILILTISATVETYCKVSGPVLKMAEVIGGWL